MSKIDRRKNNPAQTSMTSMQMPARQATSSEHAAHFVFLLTSTVVAVGLGETAGCGGTAWAGPKESATGDVPAQIAPLQIIRRGAFEAGCWF